MFAWTEQIIKCVGPNCEQDVKRFSLKVVLAVIIHVQTSNVRKTSYESGNIQGAANKSNPLPCFVNISTTNRNF